MKSRKVLFSLVLTLVLVLCAGVAMAWNPAAEDYSISSIAELKAFRDAANEGNNFSGKTIELNANIDLQNEVWTPINSFAGEFDGNNHTISNFKIDATSGNAGFFNTIEAGNGERVHDLTLSNVTATVGSYCFGTLANNVKGIVNRVTVKNVNVTTTSTNAWVGGMCAFMSWPWMNDCLVENLTINAENGADLIGGFACILQKKSNMVFDNLDVKNFTVSITDNHSSGCGVGGFVAQTQRGWEYPKVTNCDISGIDVTASGNVDVGGFIAWPGAHTTAENCTTSGKINASGVTESSNFVGGFFGNLGWNSDLGQMGHVITDCTATVDIISGGAPAGGFVGSATNSNNNSMYATFNNCTANGDVTNPNGAAGGFAGNADRGDYNNCKATGIVKGKAGAAGGFIGETLDTTIKYDHRYPKGTRDYDVEESDIDNCQAYASPFIGNIADPDRVNLDPNDEQLIYRVTFTVVPKNAVIVVTDINGDTAVVSNGVYYLKNGTYTYSISSEGYVTKNDTITVANSDLSQNITLEHVSLKGRAPQTGDNANIALWIALMAISAISFVALGRKSRFN